MSGQVIHIGTVVEVKTDKSLVKVDVLGRITDWLPVLQQANSFKRQFVSLRKNQQVVVLANRVVIGSIFNVDCSEPDGANEHIDIVEYEDGTRVEYDSEAKTLKVDAVGDLHITCKNAVVKADHFDVEATDMTFTGTTTFTGDITHNGKFNNTDGIETDGIIKDAKGDLTNHPHIGVAPR